MLIERAGYSEDLIRESNKPIRFAQNLRYNPLSREIMNLDSDEPLASLSALQGSVFHFFITHPDEVIKYDQLCRDVWKLTDYDMDFPPYNQRMVQTTVNRIKHILGRVDPLLPEHLSNIRETGYRWRSEIFMDKEVSDDNHLHTIFE
jgi:DNA-binding response OmpR family regulator